MIAATALLALAPAALAGTTPTISFGHDDTRDGDPAREIASGLFAAFPYDASLQPEDQRIDSRANGNAIGGVNETHQLWESFGFDVPAGDQNGSFTVAVTWQESAIDLDVYVYRQRPNGTYDPTPIAQSASTADPERATRYEPIAGDPIKPGHYVVYVDNWCSNDTDVFPARFFGAGGCTGTPGGLSNIDEDDFVGQITFTPFSPDNKPPSAAISGPDSGRAGDTLTFTGSGSDPDGQVRNYSFDLDGDGRFEYDNAANPAVSKRFDAPGTYNVGVRVADDRGATAYASKAVTISGAPAATTTPSSKAITPLSILSAFKLDRPVFGGLKARRLTVRYRLRAASKITLTLYKGKKRVKRLDSRTARADRTYRVLVSSKNRSRGEYTVKLTVTSADGKVRRTASLVAQRI